MMFRLLLAAVLPVLCSAQITVAAAANLSDVFPAIGRAFEAETRIPVTFSFGSTAQLAQQIESGAPFDVFAAADTVHVDQLLRKSLLDPKSRAIYATGILALWIPPGSHANIAKPEDLVSPSVRVIAVARPELAPYGEATVETLRKLGIWDRVRHKIVYATNIGVARQYGTSGNVDAVFTARSLLLKDAGKTIVIDEALHQPITQAVGIVTASRKQAEAHRFLEFLLGRNGRQILERYGYK